MKRPDPAEALADELMPLLRWSVKDRRAVLAMIRRHYHSFDRVAYMREYMRAKRAKAKKGKP